MKNLGSTVQQLVRGPVAVVAAVSLIAVGAGSLARNSTTAFFTSTANNAGNTFTTANLGAITGAANASAAVNFSTTTNPDVGALLTYSGNAVVPGDSVFGRLAFANTSGTDVTYALTTAQAGGNSLFATAEPTGAVTDKMALLIFRCTSTDPTTLPSTAVDCNDASNAGGNYLQPVYANGSYGSTGLTAPPSGAGCVDMFDGTTAVTKFQLGASRAFDKSLVLTDPRIATQYVYVVKDTATATALSTQFATATPFAVATSPATALGNVIRCTGGRSVVPNAVMMGGTKAITGTDTSAPNAGTSQGGPNGNLRGIPSAGSDYLSVIAYLPTSSGATLQNLASQTLTLNWTMSQRAGISR